MKPTLLHMLSTGCFLLGLTLVGFIQVPVVTTPLKGEQFADAVADTHSAFQPGSDRFFWDNDPTLIVPGERIGEIKLGMKRTEVVAIYGIPGRTRGEPYEAHGVISDNWPNPGIKTISFLRTGKIIEVQVYSSIFTTRDGISTKTTFNRVWRQFKHLKQERYTLNVGPDMGPNDTPLWWQSYDDTASGITFIASPSFNEIIGKDDQLYQISVHIPGHPSIASAA